MSDSYIEKAKHFIANGTHKDLPPLLIECITDGGTNALAAVLLLAETRYDFAGGAMFQHESAFPLIAWKEKGLEAIYELSLRPTSPHNWSIAVEILSSIAIGQMPSSFVSSSSSDLKDTVKRLIGDVSLLAMKADELLKRTILSHDIEEESLWELSSLFHFGSRNDSARIKKVLSAISLRWLAVGQPIINQYKTLIDTNLDDETAFQSFFEENPLFLDPLSVKVWSKPDFHGKKEPDFVIKRADNSYLIIEIETPAKQIVTRDGQIGAKVTQAVTQAMEYRTFLLERFQQAQATFPNFNPPDALVIIGLEGALSEEEQAILRRENEHRAHIRIIGYDAIADRMSAITQNLVEGRVRVEKVRLA